MLAGLFVSTRGFVMLDTFDLLFGSAAASRCIDSGVLSSCGANVDAFAVLQYVPAVAFHEIGLSFDSALDGLLAINGFAALATLGLVARTVRRAAGSGPAAVAATVVLAGPLIWYAHAGFGEALAAFAVTAYTCLLLEKAPPPLVAAAMFFAGISKETAVPFLIGIWIVVWLIHRDSAPRRSEVVEVFAGALFAVAANATFNVFRYGTVWNREYTQAHYHAPPLEALDNFAALLFSPTGGLAFTWPTMLIAIVWTVSVGARNRFRDPGVATGVLFLALLLALAQWFGPLGGATWGPRLLMPWLPALLLLAITAHPEAFAGSVRTLAASPRLLALASAFVVITGMPHLIATVDSSRYHRAPPGESGDRRELAIAPFTPDRVCPQGFTLRQEREPYYTCLHRLMWHRGVVPARAFSKIADGPVLPFALVWAAAVLSLFTVVRATRQPPARAYTSSRSSSWSARSKFSRR
jgi:hypothetical protein